MKSLGIVGSSVALASAVTREDWMFLCGVTVTILNILIEYLKSRKRD